MRVRCPQSGQQAVRLGCRAARHELADDFLDEERDARRALGEQAERSRIQRLLVEQCRDQALRVVARQAAQHQVFRAGAPALEVAGPRRQHDANGPGSRRTAQRLQKILGRTVDPLNVLDDEQDLSAVAKRDDQLFQHVEQRLLFAHARP